MPIWYYFLAVVISAIVYSLVQTEGKRKALWALISGYLFLIVSSTILNRSGSDQFEYNLKPFWTYYEIAKGTWRAKRFLEELLLNIVMLIPIGVIIPCLVKRQKLIITIASAAGISLLIELLQLVTKRGLFEFDDIIHNTLGAIIGYGVYKLVCVLERGWKNKRTIN